MDIRKKTMDEEFFKRIANRMEIESELNVKKVYSMFPEINPKTIRWRLFKLVQQGKLFKVERGYYSLIKEDAYQVMGYEYLQKKSKDMYNYISEYGYNFYISGMDALVGELLHIPEQFTVILVTEEAGMAELQEMLSGKGYFVIRENQKSYIQQNALKNKIDAVIMKGKNFELEANGIAIKEKAFTDLYFAATRLDYAISIPELTRIYESMQRNKSATSLRMKQSAKDRGIITEINWLLEMKAANPKVLEFMKYQLKEAIWTE